MNVAFKEPAQPMRSLDSIAEALFLPTGVDGVYARTAIYEEVVGGLDALISRHREPDTEVLRFPPVMSRRQLEKSGYLKSFPHLLGCVAASAAARRKSAPRSSAARRVSDWTRRWRRPISCWPRRPAIRSIRWRRAAARARERPDRSTSPAIASAASRRAISTACSRSACANMSASARPKRSMRFADAWMARAPGFAEQLGLP